MSLDSTVSLGNLNLAGEEAAIVAREALRYWMVRLGEMLHDLEEIAERVDFQFQDNHTSSSQSNEEYLRSVRHIISQLLRLMGRINSATVYY